MVKAFLSFLVCLALTWSNSSQAQQLVPEKESQRSYIAFKDAAPKIFAAAIARANRGTTDPSATPQQSYERALEYSKHIAIKLNIDLGGADFSYFSWLPHLMLGEINAETVQLKVGYGSMTGAAFREKGAFNYKLRQAYQSTYTTGTIPQARKYNFDAPFTFKTEPVLQGTSVVYTARCTGSATAMQRCSMVANYVPGSFKWYWRGGSQQVIHACNEISDCVQSAISHFMYLKTFAYKNTGSDPFQQYYGAYQARPMTACSDDAEYAHVQPTTVGVLCAYAMTFEWTPDSRVTPYFVISDDNANGYLSYITVNPIPVVCPGATKYPHFVACDPRFANEALTPKTLARLVDQLFYWGSYRTGYAGHVYTPVTTADAINALGGQLVKVSSLAEKTTPPEILAPSVPASAPGAGIDLGQNPGVGTPGLENVDAASILAPLWALFPSLRSFSVGGHASQCPVFAPAMFGSSVQFSAHCELLEGQRAAFGALALLAWVAAALFVVLKA